MIRTLVIVKPGFGKLKSQIEEAFANQGFTRVNQKRLKLNSDQVDVIWGDLKQISVRWSADYFTRYSEYVTSKEVYCMVFENQEASDYDIVFNLKHDLREQYGVKKSFQDVLHTSDSNEDADAEIACIFTE